MRNASGQQDENKRQQEPGLAGGTEKISEQEFKQQLSTYDTFSIKPVARRVSSCNFYGKELYKKVCCTCKVFFCC